MSVAVRLRSPGHFTARELGVGACAADDMGLGSAR